MRFKEKITIKNIKANNRIWLAPMAEITDRFFRKKSMEFGAGFTFSGMVSVKGLLNNYDSTMKKVGNHYENEMFSLQLFGSEPKDFYEAIKLLIEKTSIRIFDINAGCPVRKVVRSSSGSYLILHPEKIYDIVKILKDNFDITLSVKTRKGWNDEITSEKLIDYAVKAGVDFITIHPRTKEQLYTGKIDLNYAKHIRNKYDLPIILSGDITSPQDLEGKEEFDAVMVGRKAFKDIGIFSELLGLTKKINYKKLFIEHLQFYENEYKRISGFKKYLPMYFEHTKIAKKERNEIYQIKDFKNMIGKMMDSF